MKGAVVFLLIRQRTENLEENTLSKYACLSKNSAGRDMPIAPCDIRTDFQRDRDRILHSKSFRRLMNKTQVFLSPEKDHYRTRLTHTLEVSQIARTIAVALSLNEDLCEAISLGHDLGHTPFGHAGEDVLAKVCTHGYIHSRQSVRVVEYLENNGKGLNLTKEVRDGILCHSSDSGQDACTLEGRVVRYADKIAYLNHDVDDAIRANVLGEDDIPWNIKVELGTTKSQRITCLIKAIINNSAGKNDITMDKKHNNLYREFKEFMFKQVYTNPAAKAEESKAKEVVSSLYQHYIKNTGDLPAEYLKILEKEDNHRAVCDYISGMSDRFCIAKYEELFVPRAWNI